MIETNERLRVVRIRLDGSYEIAKRALVELMCKYTDSKQVRNVFQRYNLLKVMIKVRVAGSGGKRAGGLFARRLIGRPGAATVFLSPMSSLCERRARREETEIPKAARRA